MLQWSNYLRQSLYNRLLVTLLITIYHDLLTSEIGGVQAWTYNYSTNPNLDWDSARQWCRQHYTDMVAIQNQEEIVYLNTMLPKNSQYYWIGLRKVNEVWTWMGTNKTLTKEAENWATGEPNNVGDGQDCVEIYIKRGKDEAKWNDERCTKKKGALCYTASCSQHCCSIHAECLENIGDYTCQCDPGFKGPRCQEAVECDAVSDPEQGSVNCDHPHGPFAFNSSCQFHCARGYQLLGAPQLLCQATGLWDHPATQCQVKQCPALDSGPHRGTMNCSDPIALHSYNSTCEFSCDLGFDLIGPDMIQCDHTGQWTGNVSTCTVVRCAPLNPPAMGNMSCVEPLGASSFTSSCGFSCEEGYLLRGDTNLTCLSTGQWTNRTPACELVQCDAINAPPHASMNCWNPVEEFSYGSTCALECEEGFVLVGTNSTHCSSLGYWSHALPVCQAQQCDALTAPPHGSMNCSDLHGQFHYGSQCLFSCEEGFLLNGEADTECTSLGTWSRRAPLCLVVRCGPLSPPAMGNMTCVEPLGASSFTSSCGFSCEEGYLLRGDTNLTCLSTGQWTNRTPACELVQCDAINAPPHASMNCWNPVEEFSYGSTCALECEEGFVLVGTNSTHCSSLGYWSHALPVCQAQQCDALTSPPHGSMNCSDLHGQFHYGSQCLFSCEEGFPLNGVADTECTSLGTWSRRAPLCLVVRCGPLSPPAMGNMTCVEPLGASSFTSSCGFSCEEGYLLRGDTNLTCLSTGQWTNRTPACELVQCDAINAPPHASMNCWNPVEEFSYGSTCALECEEGFVLVGTNSTHCSSLGYWSHALPVCQAQQCDALTAPPHGSMNCSDLHGQFHYGSQCLFSCEEGFLLNGVADTECTSLGTWSRRAPLCLVRHCPLLVEPRRGWMNCTHPYSAYSYSSHCLLRCNEGLWLTGAPTMHCNASGVWSQDLPSCQVVQCENLLPPPPSPPPTPSSTPPPTLGPSMNCSHPLGEFSFSSLCLFTCGKGYYLNGTEELSCTSEGQWSDLVPSCQRNITSDQVSAGMLVYAAVGAASAAGLLLLLGLGMLVRKQLSKHASTFITRYGKEKILLLRILKK
ncbi:P-selectin isoform X1 [Coregonus clupeaformis]|uniref:P-selectin isoform X1 n=1 Tax=Coregonus clupeaformis TaxID=59861 RepID=UPI001E1C96C4|nr:P-selectin isoform X1 [Coregonus clupeaformis]